MKSKWPDLLPVALMAIVLFSPGSGRAQPVPVTAPATSLLNDAATLNGTVNPQGVGTTAWFEWGSGFAYGNSTPPQGVGSDTNMVAVNGALTGLTPGVTYHYRCVASNNLGVVRGANQVFWSPALTLNGSNPMTNEYHVPFVDPGAIVSGLPFAIAAGGSNSLALKTDGSVVGWGLNNYGQTNIPASVTNVVAIAAGSYHSLALKVNSTVVGWGDNWFGQTNVPTSATNVVAIAAGAYHSLALKANSTVVGWEFNFKGQTTIPASATNVVAIAAGRYHSLALKADGAVVGWGNNFFGQTNTPASATNVVAIGAGLDHSLALRADGAVVGWGLNTDGQTNSPASATNVVAIAAGGYHSMALKADGAVVGWGNNIFGQTNIPAGLNNLNLPIAVSGTVDVNVPGTYLLNYRTTNVLGAVATATRTVIVADTLPPVLTLLGNNPLMHERGAPFADPGATATDLCAGDRTGSIFVWGTVNTNGAGSYPLVYIVTDTSGNLAVTNRTVVVVTRPVLTGLAQPGNGAFHFTFTNTPGAQFNVRATTNVALPFSAWTVLGPVVESLAGVFQFTDVTATNQPARFYRVE